MPTAGSPIGLLLTLTYATGDVVVTPTPAGSTGGGGGPIVDPADRRRTTKRRDRNKEERKRREEIFARVRRLFDERENPPLPVEPGVIQPPPPVSSEIVEALGDAKRELKAFRREVAQMEFDRQIEAQLAEYEATVAEAERLMADDEDAVALLLMLAI